MVRSHRIHVIGCALALGSLLAACVSATPTATVTNPPYAVLYGHVATTNSAINVQVFGEAYRDSANAISRDSLFGGFQNLGLNDSNNYFTTLSARAVQKLYLNLQAVGVRPSSVDSVRAIPIRLDSLGGGPHDSIRVDFTLP